MERSFPTFLILRAPLRKAWLRPTDIVLCPPDWQLSKTKPNETNKIKHIHKGNKVSLISLVLLMLALWSAESTLSLFENRMTLVCLVVFCCCCLGFFCWVLGSSLVISFGRSLRTLLWNSSGPELTSFKGIWGSQRCICSDFALWNITTQNSVHLGKVVGTGISFILRVDGKKVIPWKFLSWDPLIVTSTDSD